MPKYSETFTRAANSVVSVASVSSAAATQNRRGKIYDIMMGSEDTPADNKFLWQLCRITAIGTATAIVPPPLDPADAAFCGVCQHIFTGEPTYTAASSVLSIALNQRASYRWVAAPGSEFVYPATAANGFGMRLPTTSSVAVTLTMLFEE